MGVDARGLDWNRDGRGTDGLHASEGDAPMTLSQGPGTGLTEESSSSVGWKRHRSHGTRGLGRAFAMSPTMRLLTHECLDCKGTYLARSTPVLPQANQTPKAGGIMRNFHHETELGADAHGRAGRLYDPQSLLAGGE